MTATAKTATTAEIAAEFATTPRTLRKFLRADDRGVGKGSRYALPANARDMKAMRKRFDAWAATEAATRAAKVEATKVDEDDADADA